MKTKLIDDTDSSTLRTALLEEESSADVVIQKPKRASRKGQSEEIETLQAEHTFKWLNNARYIVMAKAL